MAKLKKLGVFFFAKLQSIVMACVGIVAGILYSFGGAAYDLSTSALSSGTALAFLALIGMPIMFGVCGFVAGATEALIYNLVATRFGGIELDIEQG